MTRAKLPILIASAGIIAIGACTPYANPRQQQAAVGGALIGAIAGASTGEDPGERQRGALIGAVIGGGAGALAAGG